MNRLRNDSLSKCFSLLKEFIDEAPTLDGKKGLAGLALEQLQRITAGVLEGPYETGTMSGVTCADIPRIDSDPVNGG